MHTSRNNWLEVVQRIAIVVRGVEDLGPDAQAIAEAVFRPPGSVAAAGLRGTARARDREHACE